MKIEVVFKRASDKELKKLYKMAIISLIYGPIAGIIILFLFGYSLGGLALAFLCIFAGFTIHTFYKFLIGMAVLNNKLETLEESIGGSQK